MLTLRNPRFTWFCDQRDEKEEKIARRNNENQDDESSSDEDEEEKVRRQLEAAPLRVTCFRRPLLPPSCRRLPMSSEAAAKQW